MRALELLERHASQLVEMALGAALDGDKGMLIACLRIIAPRRGERPVTVPTKAIKSIRDANNQMASIMQATASGRLPASQAIQFAKLIVESAHLLEAAEGERRIAALEKIVQNGGPHASGP
jgi:hypothetical protein